MSEESSSFRDERLDLLVILLRSSENNSSIGDEIVDLLVRSLKQSWRMELLLCMNEKSAVALDVVASWHEPNGKQNGCIFSTSILGFLLSFLSVFCLVFLYIYINVSMYVYLFYIIIITSTMLLSDDII